ncbi:hypothetical protein E3N88_23726 [Mikania micrantha]|uniref:Phorbol-ester/DAG-type domain-containing protein n=1 Tax=Mikania micrantha TaxID=192012 RepID=A0A5N6NGM3_9ASTR|nr:hypothetical protein E3N88_23726 [Mikania micrantha]
MYPRFLQQIFNEELGTSLSLTGNTYKMPLVSSKVFVHLKETSAQFSGKFTPLLPSMESTTPEGDNSVNPKDAEPTPSISFPHPVNITYKRKRTHVQLSTVVQAPSNPTKKKVKSTAKGTVPPQVSATPHFEPPVLPLEPVAALNQPENAQCMSQHITENIQRETQIIESASLEAPQLDQRLSPRSPGSYHPEMPPSHTHTQAHETPTLAVEEPLSPTSQTLMRVVTQLQERFPDPEPFQSEVGPSSSEGVNAGEATTIVDLNKDPQDSGTGNRTSPAATNVGEDFFEALLNDGNPGSQETTSGGGGAGARLTHLEAEVTTLRLEIQTKDATILDLRRRPPVVLHPFHPDPTVTTCTSPVATKKGENASTAGSGSEAIEEEGAQEAHPSIVTLTAEWDDFLGTYFQVSSISSSSDFEDTREVTKETEQQTSNVSLEHQSPSGTNSPSSSSSSSSPSEDTREVAKETEQQTSNISLEPQSPLGTKSPSETAAQVTMEKPTQEKPVSMEPVSPSETVAQVVMEDTTQEEQISMEPVSPSRTEAAEALSSSPEPIVETNKESSKGIGQLEETVNAEVNSEAAAASKGPVILDDSSTEELHADEPIGKATGEGSSGVKITSDDKGKRKLTPEEEAEQEERIPKKKKGRPDTSMDEDRVRLSTLLEEKGYNFDEVWLWSKAYKDKCKDFLLEYGFHARQLGPMKTSTLDIHIRDIKAKIARGELPSIEQIRARKASLMIGLGLGLGGGATIEFPKEEQPSPPPSPDMDRMPISSVININKGKKATRKQSTQNLDPERETLASEKRTEPSIAEESQQARRSQATAQTKPRLVRRKSMARRKRRTSAISSDSESEAIISVPEVTPKAAPKTRRFQEDMRDIKGVYKFINIKFGAVEKRNFHHHPVSFAPGTINDSLCQRCGGILQSKLIWKCLHCTFACHFSGCLPDPPRRVIRDIRSQDNMPHRAPLRLKDTPDSKLNHKNHIKSRTTIEGDKNCFHNSKTPIMASPRGLQDQELEVMEMAHAHNNDHLVVVGVMVVVDDYCRGDLLAEESNYFQLCQDDLDAIPAEDLEEMDINYEMAIISYGAKKFYQRTCRQFKNHNMKTGFGLDKSKLKCFSCQ